jgi:Tfp pilus assembly protein PilO
LKRVEASIAFNQSLIFPADEHLSTVTASLQQQIKETAEQCGVTLTKLRTGDPEQVDQRAYERLPISFAIRGFPDQTGRFLVQIFRMDKFLRIYTMELTARRDNKLHLSLSAAAYRFLPSSDAPGEAP